MKRLLAVAAIIVALLTAAPAHASELDMAPVQPALAGYTGPAVWGLWPKAADGVATIQVYAPVDKRWSVERIARLWNKSHVVRFVLVTSPCQGCVTIKQRPTYHQAADAAIYSVDRVMQRCDITLNMASFNRQYPVFNRALVVHEMTHCLGLDHTSRPNSVMGTRDGRAEPTRLDLEWIKALYGNSSL